MGIWKQVQEVAKESNCKKRHVGCVITTADGMYISHGYNYHEDGICDCFSKEGSTAVHAEIMAINNIPIYNRGDTLHAYINHKPCDRCYSIMDSVCKEIYVNELSERLEQVEEKPDYLKTVLKERKSTHGNFTESSRFTQACKAAMQSTPNWMKLHYDQQESLHMISHKVARILYGDMDHIDSWTDIAGYAKLVEDRLNGSTESN